MNKQRKTSNILNVFQYDETTGAVTLPSTLVLTAPANTDNSTKVPTTAWTRSYVSGLNYLTGNQTITVSGDASGSGTTSINLTLANTAVTPGTYGSTTLVPVVTVDSKGRITSVTTAAISGALTFTGDVTGTGTTGTSTALTLANSGVTAGTYTKVTVDSKGRVTVGASATTSDIAEGTNLYYTDARVLAYLGANNYATQSYVGTQIANLVASAPLALDTLNELAAALGNDANFATTTATSLGNRLRIDIGTQGLTSTQQGYGRTNLGLGTAATSAVGDFATAAQGTKADSAYGWGNHASAGYLTTSSAASTYQPLDADLTSIAGLLGTTGFLKKTAANTWALDTNTYLTSFTETDPIYTASSWYSTTNNATNWNTAYSNRIASLTTTGSSGAATLSANTLNIPTYTLAGLGGQPALSGTGFVKISGTTISYDNSTYLTGITSSQVTTALGFTPYNSTNPSGYTSNVGTVTSVGGTGTVNGLTLTGTVTTSGNLTLGGTLTLTSSQITTGLGYTPYNAGSNTVITNANYTSYALRWNSTQAPTNGLDNTTIVPNSVTLFDGYGVAVPGYPSGANQWWVGALTIGDNNRGVQIAGGYSDNDLYFRKGNTTWSSWRKVWTDANLTNLNQLTNGPGYITSYSETDTLATVTARGASTTAGITVNGRMTAAGGGTYAVTGSSSQRYIIQALNTSNSVNAAYGWWWFHNANGDMGFHADAVGDILTLTRAGGATINGNTILTSGNYSSYALPLSGGTLSGSITLTSGYLRFQQNSAYKNGWSVYNGNGYLSSVITTDSHSDGWGWSFTNQYPDNASATTYFRVGYSGAVSYLNSGNFGINTTTPGYPLHVVSSTGYTARFDKNSPGGDGGVAYFVNGASTGYSSYIYIGSSPGTDWKVGKNILNPASASYPFEIVDSSGNLGMRIAAGGGTTTFPATVTACTYNSNNGYSFVAQGYNNNGGFAMNNASTYWGLMWNYAANDWRLGYGSTIAQNGWNLRWDNSGTVWANSSMRAPIFYDSDDTNYYLDPNGQSILYTTRTALKAARGLNGYGGGSWVDDFTNTPVSSMTFGEDKYSGGPSGTWWFQVNMRHQNGSNIWGTQLAYGWEDNANRMMQRNVTGGTWSAWVEYISTANIGSQSVAYASTAGLANGVAWGNVSGRPSALSQFSNDSGYITSSGSISGNAGSANVSTYARRIDGVSRVQITVGGNASTYYPVAFYTGAGSTSQQYSEFVIERGGYDDPGYSGVGFSTFNARFSYKPSGWGYEAKYWNLEQLGQTTTMLADYDDYYQASQFVVWLRGATTYWVWAVVGGISVVFENTSGTSYNATYRTFGTTTSVAAKASVSRNYYGNLRVDNNIYSGGSLISGYSIELGGSDAGNIVLSTYNNRNLRITGTGGGDVGICGRRNGGSFGFQVYGEGTSYGFLNSEWGSWNLKKVISGALYMNDNNSYYINTTGDSSFSGSLSLGGGLTTSAQTNLNAQVYINRHIDANSTWGTCGCNSIFVGWGSGKVILGNGNSGGHDYANGLGSNTVVSTNPFYCYSDITAYSDARVKENIEVVDNAIEKIKAIRGVTFTRNDTEDKNKRHAGVIAQEVLAVLPEVVSEDLNGHYSVAYGNLNALLIEAIKEQQKQIEELQNKLDNVLSSR